MRVSINNESIKQKEIVKAIIITTVAIGVLLYHFGYELGKMLYQLGY